MMNEGRNPDEWLAGVLPAKPVTASLVEITDICMSYRLLQASSDITQTHHYQQLQQLLEPADRLFKASTKKHMCNSITHLKDTLEPHFLLLHVRSVLGHRLLGTEDCGLGQLVVAAPPHPDLPEPQSFFPKVILTLQPPARGCPGSLISSPGFSTALHLLLTFQFTFLCVALKH